MRTCTKSFDGFVFTGEYQSHWRLVHKGVRFGHRVWCSIIVDPRETLEPPTADAAEAEEDVNMDSGTKQVRNTTTTK